MKVKSESEVAQSCPTLSDPMGCSLRVSSVHGIFQARVLEWVAIAFSTSMARLTKVLWLLSWVLSSSLFLSHWLTLEKALWRGLWAKEGLWLTGTKGLRLSAQQPLRSWMLAIMHKYRSRSSSLHPPPPAPLLSHLTRPQTKQVAGQQLHKRPWALAVPWFLTDRNCEIVNIYCLMLLNLGISYYAAIDN